VNPVIDQMMAARLGPGSVASLGYGNKLVAFIAGILGTSLGAAVFPHFSKLAGAKDWVGLNKTIRTYMRAMTLVAIPITLATVGLSVPIVRILFERGAFTPTDTVEVAKIQALYALQVPFRMASLVLVRFIIASAENRALMVFSIVNAIVNVFGNWALSSWLGAPGIALSTSVVYAVSFGMNLWLFRRRMRGYLAGPAGFGEATAA
jgi:putative peptidoglycan lipid II flippase